MKIIFINTENILNVSERLDLKVQINMLLVKTFLCITHGKI